MLFRKTVAITPHDTNVVPGGEIHGIWVTATGTVKFETPDGTQATVTLTQHTLYPGIVMTKILSSGTSATGILGFRTN